MTSSENPTVPKHTENPATNVAGSALTPTAASSNAAAQPGASADPSVNLNQDREASSPFHANPPNCPSVPSVSRMAQPSVPSHSICIPYRRRFANSSAEGITSYDNSGRIRPLLFPGHSPPPLLALLEQLSCFSIPFFRHPAPQTASTPCASSFPLLRLLAPSSSCLPFSHHLLRQSPFSCSDVTSSFRA